MLKKVFFNKYDITLHIIVFITILLWISFNTIFITVMQASSDRISLVISVNTAGKPKITVMTELFIPNNS